MFFLLEKILGYIIIIVPVLISVAFLTLAERKIMGSVQQRFGPNVVGLNGTLQPIADAVKLMVKETIIPSNANTIGFIIAPLLSLFISLLSWSIIPFSNISFFINFDLGLLILFCLSSLAVYGVIVSGWSSNSRYAYFGALRSTSQMISYEVSFGLILIVILLCVGSINLTNIVAFQHFIFFIVPFLPLFIMFLISILAETNRAPFDLPEAESELVSGFNVEYSSMGFALFFLAEYSSMIIMSCIVAICFLGGWLIIFKATFFIDTLIISFKINLILFFYIWVRSSFPRYRIDQLMRLCWKIFLPLALSFILLVMGILFFSNGIF